jgi:hypothetical protein
MEWNDCNNTSKWSNATYLSPISYFYIIGLLSRRPMNRPLLKRKNIHRVMCIVISPVYYHKLIAVTELLLV